MLHAALALTLAAAAAVAGLGPDPVVEIVVRAEDASPAPAPAPPPASAKLGVTSTGTAELGAPFLLSCSAPDHAHLELCTWRRGGLAPMFVQESGLYDHRRNKIEGISVVQADNRWGWTRQDIIIIYHCNRITISNARNCSISITAVSPADLGTWTCRVHHSASSTWQEAHVEVATRDQDDINVRLPANVRPSRWI